MSKRFKLLSGPLPEGTTVQVVQAPPTKRLKWALLAVTKPERRASRGLGGGAENAERGKRGIRARSGAEPRG